MTVDDFASCPDCSTPRTGFEGISESEIPPCPSCGSDRLPALLVRLTARSTEFERPYEADRVSYRPPQITPNQQRGVDQ